ncbi:hypothetical protein LMG28688_03950 [Paraburkholderia caffeinitolerans]|uniref:Uncharacterized protein n=1 Tax=Paraburkholderia caffeinitolerans TaxID=1723730 RepID=A0A6J5GA51_9BURK|nr:MULTISPECIES: hypothetical protein [Paraburkholderia]CAB3794708.1 hypothetical protein LMG28688_03950 [Paraburkholderia caffeinitolerans]
MRLIPSNVRRSVTGPCGMLAAVLIPAVLFAFAPSVRAQTTTDVASASVVAANSSVVPATNAAMTSATLDMSMAPDSYYGTSSKNLSADMSARTLAADPGPAGDDPALAGIGALDDQTLERQRGGAVGMVMVAATPQLMRGNGVTLWDEIAPPAPLPIPVDAGQAAQGNIASYVRK